MLLMPLSDKRVMLMFSHRPWHRELPGWYPPSQSTLLLRLERLGLYHDEHNSFGVQMASQRKERGKGPPDKGQAMSVYDHVCMVSTCTGEGKQRKSKKKR